MREATARRLSLAVVGAAALAGAALVATAEAPGPAAALALGAGVSSGDGASGADSGDGRASAAAPGGADAPAPPSPTAEPHALDDLRSWVFLDLARAGASRLALVASRGRLADDRYLTIPDGRRIYAREVRLALIERGAVRSTRLDAVCVILNDAGTGGNSALDASGGLARAFVDYRAYDPSQWGFDGAVYDVALPSLSLVRKASLYQNENRGAFPFFEGRALLHFAHDGYRYWRDAERGERVEPGFAEFRYLERLRARTDGMLPGPSDEVVRRLAAGW